MLHRWIPWKIIVKQAAKAYGILDPISVMARVRRFAQPSEVQEPIELLRAGIVFHARGLINTKAIQHNLDWVWPYWVERQFNPRDVSFIPRGFSFSHVNLTHRNWTAVGLPNLAVYPIVDPRGLLTPMYDGWSIDCWLRLPDGTMILPSREKTAEQLLHIDPTLCVETVCRGNSWKLRSLCSLEQEEGRPVVTMQAEAQAPAGAQVIISLRPYNPEGVQFIEKAAFDPQAGGWRINNRSRLFFDTGPDRVLFSKYADGDVLHRLAESGREESVSCKVGMATAAALFTLSGESKTGRTVTARIPLPSGEERKPGKRAPRPATATSWPEAVTGSCRFRVPEEPLTRLSDQAVRTLILLSAQNVVPGPYTYRRFWFRDACFMLHAMLNMGFVDSAYRIIQAFPLRQKKSGYFQSQTGEWDSNGQVLWLLDRYEQLSGRKLDPEWLPRIISGMNWIVTKRLPHKPDHLHAGLLPAGFSAEHLGPNDYYYWDNFWGVAGLHCASRILERHGSERQARFAAKAGEEFWLTIWDSIESLPAQRTSGGIPASPYRRLDAGAIGSLVMDYPLSMNAPGHPRIMKTVEFLQANCFHQGGFFQDMIHSGINPYLTLCIAQSLLRAGDQRCLDLVRTVAGLASPTGQWPEAVHPLTKGGCMGDGQHGWAAAEWVMMLRNLFVREEGGGLIVGSGLDPAWLDAGEPAEFGPTPTPFGSLSVSAGRKTAGSGSVRLFGNIDPSRTPIDICVPGYTKTRVTDLDHEIVIHRE